MRAGLLFPFVLLSASLLVGCGAPKPQACGPTTCNGCCDAAGTCRGGNEESACGVSGASCTPCFAGQLCQFGFCISTASGGGGGSTGGGGGATGGGGGATGGGGGATGGGGGSTGGGGGATSCDQGCFTPTPQCDPATNTCVGCLTGADCSSATPVCEPTTRRCVACATNVHCGGSTPYCDTARNACATCTATQGCSAGVTVCDTSVEGGRCVRCLGNADCGGATPVCDTGTKQCVACTTGQGCGGATPVCDTAVTGGRCVACTASSHCGGTTPLCDTGTNQCVACLSSSDCGGGTPVCDATAKRCVTCTATAGCGGATPACDTSVAGGRCVGCLSSASCGGATPVCDTAAKACVRCTATAGCGGSTPVCDTAVTGGQCVGCLANTQCSGATPVCNLATRTCATCTATQGCGGSTPVCDTSVGAGQCVGCLSSASCGGTTPVCNTSTRTCVRCTATQGCGGATPVCDTAVAGGQCVGCLSSANCGGTTPICNTSARACVTCTATQGCGGSTPVCDTSAGTGQCVGCLTGANCGGTTPVCNTTTRQCVGCVSSATCGGATPVCLTSTGTCVQCLTNTQCGGTTPLCDTTTSRCVGCLSNANCGGSTPYCNGTTGACVQCTSSTQCANPTPVCGAASTCAACTSTLDCTQGTSCAAPSCVANPESCASAQTLTLASGQTMLNFQADLRRAIDDVDGSCSGTGTTAELVYRLPLAQAADVTISVAKAAGQGTSDPVFFVRRGDCAMGQELTCQDETFTNDTESVTLYGQAAGDLSLFIEAWSASNAVLSDVSIVLAPPTPPPANDSCASPQALTFTNGEATVAGSFILANNDNASADPSPSCSSAARSVGRDLVYRYTLSQAQDVRVEVLPRAGSGVTPVVYARRLADCANPALGAELACVAGGASGVLTRFINQPPGDYALWVDSVTAAQGAFDLSVSLLPPTLPPTNDTCASPTPLAFTGGRASTTGQTVGAGNDFVTLACASMAGALGRDVVYSVTVPTPGPLSVVVASLSSDWAPVASMSATCPTGGDLDCTTGRVGAVAGALVAAADAGTHYVFVDGVADGGFFRLDGRLGAPPNDTCATAAPLALSTAMVDNSVLDHTRLAANDLTEACGRTTSFSGKELFFTFTPATSGTVTLRAWPDSNFDVSLAVFSGTCGALTCLDTEDVGARGGPETLPLTVMAGTTYTVVVDGYGYTTPSEGFFRLEVR